MKAPSQGNSSRPGPAIVAPRIGGTALLHQFSNQCRRWTIADERWPQTRAYARVRGRVGA